jgi:hypothetical protein
VVSEGKTDYMVNGYLPHDAVINYMRDRLHFEKTRNKLKLKGQDLAGDNSYRNLKKRKTDVLDIMFKSMADILFFKSIAKHQELQDIFEDDIMDLLGIKRNVCNITNPVLSFMTYWTIL